MNAPAIHIFHYTIPIQEKHVAVIEIQIGILFSTATLYKTLQYQAPK